ncbi:Uncharacterised protein [Hafnia alvei]|nr:Uncharacterised protein [Hafnia alvei]
MRRTYPLCDYFSGVAPVIQKAKRPAIKPAFLEIHVKHLHGFLVLELDYSSLVHFASSNRCRISTFCNSARNFLELAISKTFLLFDMGN